MLMAREISRRFDRRGTTKVGGHSEIGVNEPPCRSTNRIARRSSVLVGNRALARSRRMIYRGAVRGRRSRFIEIRAHSQREIKTLLMRERGISVACARVGAQPP